MSKTKYNYLTKKEAGMTRQEVNLHIIRELQSCKTKKEMCNLLNDIRQHEKQLIKTTKRLTKTEKEVESIKRAGIMAHI